MTRKSTVNEADVLAEQDEDDAVDPRSFEHPQADAVRRGELSAAQLEGGNGNVDSAEPDAQYPPGVVQNSAPVRPLNAAATPDYGTNAEE